MGGGRTQRGQEWCPRRYNLKVERNEERESLSPWVESVAYLASFNRGESERESNVGSGRRGTEGMCVF